MLTPPSNLLQGVGGTSVANYCFISSSMVFLPSFSQMTERDVLGRLYQERQGQRQQAKGKGRNEKAGGAVSVLLFLHLPHCAYPLSGYCNSAVFAHTTPAIPLSHSLPWSMSRVYDQFTNSPLTNPYPIPSQSKIPFVFSFSLRKPCAFTSSLNPNLLFSYRAPHYTSSPAVVMRKEKRCVYVAYRPFFPGWDSICQFSPVRPTEHTPHIDNLCW